MKNDWVAEPEAAKMVGRAPRTLRRYVKNGKWPVSFSAINGRKFFYSENEIEKLMNSFSSRTNKQ